MNFNLDEYNKVEAKEMGEFENLVLGGHEIIIKDAREYTSDFSGNTSLKVCVDIAGNDKQKDFFQKQFENSTQENKKWSTSATKFLSLKDESLGFLKGFITACEKSNNGFKFYTKGKWEQLNGLKLAGQFGLEEYLDNDNNVKTYENMDRMLKKKDIVSVNIHFTNGRSQIFDLAKNRVRDNGVLVNKYEEAFKDEDNLCIVVSDKKIRYVKELFA